MTRAFDLHVAAKPLVLAAKALQMSASSLHDDPGESDAPINDSWAKLSREATSNLMDAAATPLQSQLMAMPPDPREV